MMKIGIEWNCESRRTMVGDKIEAILTRFTVLKNIFVDESSLALLVDHVE